jgi:hypothetical protein
LVARIIIASAHEIVHFRHTRPITARFIRAGIVAPGGRAASSRAGRGPLRQLGGGLQRQCGGGRLRQLGGGLLRQCAHEIVYLRHASPTTATFIRAAVVDPR